jgi:S-DNA-T family DNA segregation ATPase FtsK/SpoIIIE
MPLINSMRVGRRHGIRVATWRLPLPVLATWLVGRAFARAVAAIVRWWRVIVPAAFLTWMWSEYGGTAVLVLVLALAVTNVAWWRRYRSSWRRFIGFPALARWRRMWVYRRRWAVAMTATGLGSRWHLPALRRVRCDTWTDGVTIRLLPGQTPGDYGAMASRLARTFRVLWARAIAHPRPELVTLVLYRADPLDCFVWPFRPVEAPDLTGLQVGAREDGAVWRLRLSGTQVLIAGATGSGKSALLWAILAALAGGIRAGLVQVWAIDPKGGIELAAGATLFGRFAYTDDDEYAALLEDAVKTMRRRADRMRGQTRQHQATVDDPTIVVIVDELAVLTAYLGDRKTKDRIRAALSLLLTQGRAVGVHVIAAVQDPRKEIVAFRDLFPTRVALRMTEPEQVDLVLGDGARSRGAVADLIPLSMPGIGYAVLDGVPEPVRVRVSYWDDEHIASLTREYCPASGGAK